MAEEAALLPGTLDLLILKALSLAPEHGYGVLLRIEQITGGSLQVQQGALYPALYRLEQQGLIESEWGVSDNNRRAKYIDLFNSGVKALQRAGKVAQDDSRTTDEGSPQAAIAAGVAWRGGGVAPAASRWDRFRRPASGCRSCRAERPSLRPLAAVPPAEGAQALLPGATARA